MVVVVGVGCFLVLVVPRFLCLVYCLLARVVVWCFWGGGWLVFVLCARSLVVVVCAFLGCWSCLWGGAGGVPRWVIGLLFIVCWLVRVWGVWLRVFGERGCLGAGCVVRGGGLPVWLGDAVAGGGASVGFDVGGRVFTFGGVSVPGSGSSPVVLVSGEAGSCSVSGSGVSSVVSVSSGSSLGVGGVAVCVPCARAVFGDSWCGLVLRRWCAAAGVDVAQAGVLLGSAPGSGSVRSVASGSVPSSRVSGLSSPSSCSPSSVSGSVSASSAPVSSPGCASVSGSSAGSVSSASLRSASAGGGRVGAGFGARVRDWGARVGVGGGVVSGGGVLSGWWGRWRERASGLASSVGVWGLVLAGGVGVVVLVSVLVLVG